MQQLSSFDTQFLHIESATTAYKILAGDPLPHALTITAPRLSDAAKEAITAAGGSFEETAAAEHKVRNRIHRRKAAAAAAAGTPAPAEG